MGWGAGMVSMADNDFHAVCKGCLGAYTARTGQGFLCLAKWFRVEGSRGEVRDCFVSCREVCCVLFGVRNSQGVVRVGGRG